MIWNYYKYYCVCAEGVKLLVHTLPTNMAVRCRVPPCSPREACLCIRNILINNKWQYLTKQECCFSGRKKVNYDSGDVSLNTKNLFGSYFPYDK